MNHKRLLAQIVSLFLVVLVSAACGTAQPAPTPVPPTATPVPPTATPVPPTATVLPATATTPSPTAMPSLGPSPRGYVSMAYDTESDRVILFGGQTGIYTEQANYNGETWAYDVAANEWTQMEPPSGPTGRGAAELAYDAESDRVVLFGGGNKVAGWDLADTWAYDYNTNTWTEMARGPIKHVGPRIAYDAESDRIILFGGYDMKGFFYNDTWAYDFNSDTWTEMKPSTSPPGRNYQAMAYDAESDRVLTWGGLGLDGKLLAPSVWAYDFNTNTWQEMKTGEGPHPEGADFPAMVYDAKADRTILYGGVYQGDQTWAYDYNTNTWTKLEPSTVPGELSRHAMVYSTAADRVILFGGQVGPTEFKYTAETWTYDLSTNTWTNVTPQP
jgi:N-acetylneuraminic acid mutarotase